MGIASGESEGESKVAIFGGFVEIFKQRDRRNSIFFFF